MTEKKVDHGRREFMTRALTGLAAAGIFKATRNLPGFPSKQEKIVQTSPKEIIRRKLGKTGISLPIVNMGVMNSLDPALVKKSYEIGVRHFDTAAWYMRGRNEEMLGNVFKELKARDQVIIGTKVYIPHEQRNMSAEKVKASYLKIAEESLKRLQTDHVDILYSHVVDNLDWLNNPGIHEALQLLKQQGKARFIGFSTHQNMVDCINEASRTGFYDVILTSFNYAFSDYQELLDALKQAASKGIGLIAMKTQCSQYWYKENLPAANQKFYEGSIMHTAVLKWALRHDFITTTIPGYTTFQQMEEDFAVAYNLDYLPEEKKFLEDRNVKFSLGYCRQCQRCVPTCPQGVDIPTLMRTHMYATCYTNFYQAKDALQSIPEERNLHICSSCDRCLASCASRIDIPRRIDELKMIYMNA